MVAQNIDEQTGKEFERKLLDSKNSNGAEIFQDESEVWYVHESTQHALREIVDKGPFFVVSKIHSNITSAALTSYGAAEDEVEEIAAQLCSSLIQPVSQTAVLIDTDGRVVEEGDEACSEVDARSKISTCVHLPMDAEAARRLISLYSLLHPREQALPPLFVRCSGRDTQASPEADWELCYMGISFDADGNYETYRVSKRGRMPRDALPRRKVLQAEFGWSSSVSAGVETVFELSQQLASSKQATKRTSAVKLCASWETTAPERLNLLAAPPLIDSVSRMEFPLADGECSSNEVRSTARRLRFLQKLLGSQQGDSWPVRCGTCLFDEVQHFIEEEQTIALEQRSNGGAAAMFRDTTCVQTSQGDNTVFGGADLNGTGDVTHHVGRFASRPNLDFTDRLAEFAEGAQDIDDLADSLDAVLEAVKKGQIKPCVNKHNQTEIAKFTRTAIQLSHERSRLVEHVAAAQTNKLASTMESIVERSVQAVAQAGLHRVLQDYMAWFTLGISVSSSQLQWFQAADSSLEVQLSRVASLHYAVQLLDTALAVHTPWERLQSLLLAALQYLQRNDIHNTQSTTQIVLPLPAFVRSSSNLLSGLAERFADSWKMRAVHHENSDEHVLLLTQNETLDLSGDSEELQTSEEISGCPGWNSAAPVHGDGVSKSERDVKDLLNPEYSVYVGVKQKCIWSV